MDQAKFSKPIVSGHFESTVAGESITLRLTLAARAYLCFFGAGFASMGLGFLDGSIARFPVLGGLLILLSGYPILLGVMGLAEPLLPSGDSLQRIALEAITNLGKLWDGLVSLFLS